MLTSVSSIAFDPTVSSKIVVTFSGPIDPSTLANSDIIVEPVGNGRLAASNFSASVNAGGTVATFQYENGFFNDGNYTVELKNDDIKDAAGANLAKDASSEFFFLSGDATGPQGVRDRKSDEWDAALVQANLGMTSATFFDGDFDGDGEVSIYDADHVYGAQINAPVTGVSGLAVSQLSTGAVQLTWTRTSNTNIGFTVQKSSDRGRTHTNFALTPTLTASSQSGSINTTTLNAMTAGDYLFRIRTNEPASNGAPTPSRYISTSFHYNGPSTPPPPPLGAPTSLSVATVGKNSLTLSWVDQAANETGFEILKSIDGGVSYPFRPVVWVPNSTSWTDTGLKANTRYDYQVRALETNGVYSASSGPAHATTLSGSPSVLAGDIDAAAPQKLFMEFDQPIFPTGASFGTGSVAVYSLTEGRQLIGGGEFDAAGITGDRLRVQMKGLLRTDLPNATEGVLADGNYEITVRGDAIRNAAGLEMGGYNWQTSDLEGIAQTFFFLGDANHDRSVNFADLTALSQNYGLPDRTYTQGDFNSDGNVDFLDLTILSQRYGSTYAAPPTGVNQLQASTGALADPAFDPLHTATNFNAAYLEWTPPSAAVGSFAGYKVWRSQDGVNFGSSIATLPDTQLNYIDRDLNEGSKYYYRVRPYLSGGGYLTTTNKASVVTSMHGPEGLTAMAESPTSIRLQWTEDSSVETRIDVYYQTADGDDLGEFTLPANSTSALITGLNEGQSYRFFVGSASAASHSAWAEALGTTQLDAPTELQAALQPNGSVMLSWQDNSSFETGVQIQRATSSTFASDTTDFNVPTGTTSFIDSGNTVGGTSYYRVRSINTEASSSYTRAVRVDSTVGGAPAQAAHLDAPQKVTASSDTGSLVTIRWKDVSTGEVNFLVQRLVEDGAGWIDVAVVAANATIWYDNASHRGRENWYRVAARSTDGLLAFSDLTQCDVRDATINAPSAITGHVTAAGGTISWQDNSDNEAGFDVFVGGYKIGTFPPNTTHIDTNVIRDHRDVITVRAAGRFTSGSTGTGFVDAEATSAILPVSEVPSVELIRYSGGGYSYEAGLTTDPDGPFPTISEAVGDLDYNDGYEVFGTIFSIDLVRLSFPGGGLTNGPGADVIVQAASQWPYTTVPRLTMYDLATVEFHEVDDYGAAYHLGSAGTLGTSNLMPGSPVLTLYGGPLFPGRPKTVRDARVHNVGFDLSSLGIAEGRAVSGIALTTDSPLFAAYAVVHRPIQLRVRAYRAGLNYNVLAGDGIRQSSEGYAIPVDNEYQITGPVGPDGTNELGSDRTNWARLEVEGFRREDVSDGSYLEITLSDLEAGSVVGATEKDGVFRLPLIGQNVFIQGRKACPDLVVSIVARDSNGAELDRDQIHMQVVEISPSIERVSTADITRHEAGDFEINVAGVTESALLRLYDGVAAAGLQDVPLESHGNGLRGLVSYRSPTSRPLGESWSSSQVVLDPRRNRIEGELTIGEDRFHRVFQGATLPYYYWAFVHQLENSGVHIEGLSAAEGASQYAQSAASTAEEPLWSDLVYEPVDVNRLFSGNTQADEVGRAMLGYFRGMYGGSGQLMLDAFLSASTQAGEAGPAEAYRNKLTMWPFSWYNTSSSAIKYNYDEERKLYDVEIVIDNTIAPSAAAQELYKLLRQLCSGQNHAIHSAWRELVAEAAGASNVPSTWYANYQSVLSSYVGQVAQTAASLAESYYSGVAFVSLGANAAFVVRDLATGNVFAIVEALPLFGRALVSTTRGAALSFKLQLGSGSLLAKFDKATCMLFRSPGCFEAGTLVSTVNGQIPIDDVQVGQTAAALDVASGAVTSNAVVATSRVPASAETVRISTAGQSILATANHPIWVVEGDGLAARPATIELNGSVATSLVGRWVNAWNVHVGDQLLRADGRTVVVESIDKCVAAGMVYNLTIDTAHTFFVGEEEWLVHNGATCSQEQFDAIVAAWKSGVGVNVKEGVFVINGRRVRWGQKALQQGGSVTVDLDTEQVRVFFKKGGFPDFAPFLHPDPNIAVVHLNKLNGTREADVKAANKLINRTKTPIGYQWHHSEELGRMELVQEDVHSAVAHTGGVAVFMEGMKKWYRDRGLEYNIPFYAE